MKLYHYTSVPLACGIFSTSLKHGHYSSQHNGVMRPVVWLTSSLNEKEHGLLSGEKIANERQRQYVAAIQGGVPKNAHTHEKTKIRIEVLASKLTKMPLNEYRDTNRTDWRGLIDFEKFSKYVLGEDKLYRQSIGLSCHYDLATLPDSDLRKLLTKKLTNLLSWKLHFGDIPPAHFLSVKYKQHNGYVPFDFEAHGRTECANVGIHYLSAEALQEFAKICEPVNQWEIPMIAAICSSLEAKPHLVCRSGSNEWIVHLDGGMTTELLAGQVPSDIDRIRQLIASFKDDALLMWDKAVESYKDFYPV